MATDITTRSREQIAAMMQQSASTGSPDASQGATIVGGSESFVDSLSSAGTVGESRRSSLAKGRARRGVRMAGGRTCGGANACATHAPATSSTSAAERMVIQRQGKGRTSTRARSGAAEMWEREGRAGDVGERRERREENGERRERGREERDLSSREGKGEESECTPVTRAPRIRL
eukprot:scaffold197023_cov35-Tisochrysis_lutea.AAC.2